MPKISEKILAKFRPGGATHVLRTYLMLSKQKLIGEHWLWCALERVANGEPEFRVMEDYGYVRDRAEALRAQPWPDGCTESNCRRCRTPPAHRGDMAHAGSGSYPNGERSDG